MERTVPTDVPVDYGKAVDVLTGMQAREFLLEVRHRLKDDSEYLVYHRMSLGIEMQRILIGSGVLWQRDAVERHGFQILNMALNNMR